MCPSQDDPGNVTVTRIATEGLEVYIHPGIFTVTRESVDTLTEGVGVHVHPGSSWDNCYMYYRELSDIAYMQEHVCCFPR
jgi:hypothetical protein